MKSEDVQYMRFDSCGNLYLYEPGAGMSGEAKRVIEFGSDEVIYADCEVKTKSETPVKSICQTKVHRLVPHNGDAAVITQVADSQPRYLLELLFENFG